VKKLFLASLLSLLPLLFVQAQVKPGDPAPPFSLKNVDGTIVTLSDYNNQKGVILVFTSNLCPFSKAYEQRIIQLHRRFSSVGFPVVAINSNSLEISPDDSFSHMKQLSDEKDYPFPYLKDETQEICKAFGATRNPQIYLLEKSSNGFKIAYMGAIDDNSLDSKSVANNYVEKAIFALIQGTRPTPATTRPIGCIIKTTN
jgi:peroxiredoxin